MYPTLPTPTILVDLDRLQTNIDAMQARCDAADVELRPHIKTHKMVEVARRQLQAGAAGLTCAKIGEAEAMLPAFEGLSGPREIFIAHSLVDPLAAPRLQSLHAGLDTLYVACTSEAHAPALENLAAAAGLTLQVMMALDTGLGREGARGSEGAVRLARLIATRPHLCLRGLYTHEGHFYAVPPEESDAQLRIWYQAVCGTYAAVTAALGDMSLVLWPGCSVTAYRLAAFPGVAAVRPGAYVFGDLSQTDTTGVMSTDAVALRVLATVVDRPEPGLALLDAGSKTFSSDRTAAGIFARCEYGDVTRVSEEHGFLTGPRVDELEVGRRIALTPAHVCTVVNLTDEVKIESNGQIIDTWRVDARGKTQ